MNCEPYWYWYGIQIRPTTGRPTEENHRSSTANCFSPHLTHPACTFLVVCLHYCIFHCICQPGLYNINMVDCFVTASRSRVSNKQRNTSNMWKHLEVHHPVEYKLSRELKPQTPKNLKRPIPTFTSTDGGNQRNLFQLQAWSGKRSDNINQAIARYICKSFAPLSTVESESFSSLINVLDSRHKVPGRKAFTDEIIPRMYNTTRDMVLKEITSEAAWYCVTTDAWTSSVTMTPFLSLTLHYIDSGFHLQSKALDTIHMPQDHTGQNIADVITDALAKWNLDLSRLLALTTDNGSNMLVAARIIGKPRVPCFGHVLHNGVNQAIKVKAISDTLQICKKISNAFAYSSKKRRELHIAQADLNVPDHALITSCATRWGSSYASLERLKEQQEPVLRVLGGDKKTADLVASWWQRCGDIDGILSGLKDFSSLTDALSGDNYVTASSVLPLIRKISAMASVHPDAEVDEQADVDEDTEHELAEGETDLAQHIKNVVAQYIRPRFNHWEVQVTLAVSTFLDPRYKAVLLTEQQEQSAKLRILEDGGSYLDQEQEAVPPSNSSNDSASSQLTVPPKKKVKSLCDLLLDDVCCENPITSSREKVQQELDTYLVQCRATGDPLEWWCKNSAAYPVLSYVARKYLAVPGTSCSSERLFSTAGNVITQTRNRLKPDNASMLIFLNKNLP